MTHCNSKYRQNELLLRLAFTTAFVIALVGAATIAQESPANPPAKSSAVQKIVNSDIEWDSLGFHGRPRLRGVNAVSVWESGIREAPDLMKRLDDDSAFEAAHVLLTSLWRVPEKKKNSFSHALSDGFFVCHNGLHVRITWAFESGEEKKTVEIPDLSCQRKRIRAFWNVRFRDHPEEFSPDTKIE